MKRSAQARNTGGDDRRLDELIRTSLLTPVARLAKLLPKVRSGADPEVIHDVRVATRRLREAAAIFEPLIGKKASRQLRKSARSLTRGLGGARNLDEAITYFKRLEKKAEARSSAKGAAATILRWLEKKRHAAREGVDRTVAGFDAGKLHRDVEKLLDHVGAGKSGRRPVRSGRGGDAVRAASRDAEPVFAAAAFAARWQRVVERRRRALEDARPSNLHGLRIEVKKYRYALEILAPLFKVGYEERIARARGWQTTLGRIHDLDVFLDIARARLHKRAIGRLEKAMLMERRKRYDAFLGELGRLDAPAHLISLITDLRRPGAHRRRQTTPPQDAAVDRGAQP